jgi:uncharacterized protein
MKRRHMKKIGYILLLVLILIFSCQSGDELDRANDAYRKGDYATALELIKPSAEKGSQRAQYNLGIMYSKGQGVSQNFQEAAKWWLKSANQGNAKAQYSMGVLHTSGQGVNQDYREAEIMVPQGS